jgi:hypothetical protein
MNIQELTTKQDLILLEKKLLVAITDIIYKKIYPSKAFYSPKEFSAQTGMKYSTVIYKAKMGKLKARQDDPNCSWQISAEEIERYFTEASENL